jgi:two-component system response regulator AtoC
MAENKAHLLLVEDEPALRLAVADLLADAGFHVVQAHSGEEAVLALSQFAFDVVLTDLRLPGIGGAGVLETALDRYPDIIVIVMTGYGTVRDAVAMIKRGATDFITKPFQNDELLHVMNGALEQRRLRTENAYLRSQLQDRYRFEGLIGQSRIMRELFDLLATVASTPSTILIGGETGTGKELVARAIHHNSPRREQRFVAINCGALPETLLEAELFGHVRGAFTGAVGQRTGRLEQAHRGTLFLDEVGTMSPALQTKLLRVLQEREFERVGESKPTRIDVRIIAATNSDLARMVKDGTFREDLFYRLNVIPVRLPSLRERREDVPLLAQHFLDRIGREMDPPRTGVSFSQEALRRLMAYDWPGNVRELENTVERALTLNAARSQIEVAGLPAEVQESGAAVSSAPTLPETGFDLESYIGSLERELIGQSLARTGGNKRQAATLLGLKRTTLVEKLKRLERVR